MDTIIIGAGTQARVTASIIKSQYNFNLIGFIDIEKTGKYIDGIKVIGDHAILEDLFKEGVKYAVIAVSDNYIRESHYYKLKNIGFNLINVIHPSVFITDNFLISEGVIIESGVIISNNVRIGNNTIIETGCIIGANVEIGDNVYIEPGVVISGDVIIHRNVHIQCGASIRGHVIIGKNAVISAGASVISNIDDQPISPNYYQKL